jgi:hypothetical protein
VRLSELIHAKVVDEDGRRRGRVHDVRLVQDGPLSGADAAFRVDAVVIGAGSLGTRLGYLRGGVKGPWLLRTVFGRLERRASVVPMGDVEWDAAARRVTVRAATIDEHRGRHEDHGADRRP